MYFSALNGYSDNAVENDNHGRNAENMRLERFRHVEMEKKGDRPAQSAAGTKFNAEVVEWTK
jgi:hypothetical protein